MPAARKRPFQAGKSFACIIEIIPETQLKSRKHKRRRIHQADMGILDPNQGAFFRRMLELRNALAHRGVIDRVAQGLYDVDGGFRKGSLDRAARASPLSIAGAKQVQLTTWSGPMSAAVALAFRRSSASRQRLAGLTGQRIPSHSDSEYVW